MFIIDYLYHGARDVRMTTIQWRGSRNPLRSGNQTGWEEEETDVGKMRGAELDMVSTI
jgi:hypothetical protein